MNSKSVIYKAFTTSLLVALIATCSMVTLAIDGKTSGEIVVTGNSAADTAAVTVNGEPVKSGRTIFSSSTISTSEGAGAILNLGKAGRIELAPDTTFALSFDDAAISGSLAAGSITVLSATKSVSVRTLSGEAVMLNAGDTASANANGQTQATVTNAGHNNWWAFALIFGGAVAGIILATKDGNDNNFGATAGTGVSPTS
jgi:hypothetical protein